MTPKISYRSLLPALAYGEDEAAFPRPLQGVEVLGGEALVVGPEAGVGVVGEGALHVALDVEVFEELESHAQAGGGYPAVVVKISFVEVAHDGGDGVGDHGACTYFADGAELEVFVFPEGVALDEAYDEVVVAVGVLQVHEVGGNECVFVVEDSVDFAFHVHDLVVGDYVFQVVPAEFDAEVVFVVEHVADAHVILGDSEAVDVPPVFHVGFVVSGSVVEGEVVVGRGVVDEADVAARIPVAVVSPLKVQGAS